MSIISVKQFLLLLFLAHYQSVCVGLHQSLANGYVLKKSEEINIAYGDPLDLFCTGEDNKIMMTKDGEEEFGVPTTIVNQTTIRYFEKKPELGTSVYYCDDIEEDRQETVFVKIIVDLPPEAANFRCVSKNFVYLNCTWTSPNTFCNFSLYYVNSASLSLLCRLDDFEHMTCVWDKKNPSIPYQANEPMLTFLMKTCNHMMCRNQTFIIHQDEVLKLDPPQLNYVPGHHRIVLFWTLPRKYYERNLKIDHRINYWYSGMDFSVANSSFLLDARHCMFYTRLDEERTCEYKLNLPCADTFYEIRMSIKSVEAVGEEYWSNDAVVSFVTRPEPENANKKDHPTCNHQRVKITPEVMLFKIDKLKEKMKDKHAEIKEKIKLLKLKRNELRKP